MPEALSTIKAGDEVAVYDQGRFGPYLAKVERVTPTQIIVERVLQHLHATAN